MFLRVLRSLRHRPSIGAAGVVPVTATLVALLVAVQYVPTPGFFETAVDPIEFWRPAAAFVVATGVTRVAAIPLSAAVLARVRADDAPDAGDRTRRRTGDALFCGLAIAVAALPLAVVAVVAFLSVGTVLEAVGYLAFGGTIPGPAAVANLVLLGVTAAVVVDAAVAWLGAVTGRPRDAGRWAYTRTRLRTAARRPRAAIASAVPFAALTAVPYVVALVVTPVALAAGAGTTAAVVAGTAGFAIAGIPAYAARSLDRGAASGDDGPPDPDRGRWRTVALASVVVLAVVAGGTAVRAADVRPGGITGPPGPPTDKPAHRAVVDGVTSIPRTGHHLTLRVYNTTDDRRIMGVQHSRYDRSNRRLEFLQVQRIPEGGWAVSGRYYAQGTKAVAFRRVPGGSAPSLRNLQTTFGNATPSYGTHDPPVDSLVDRYRRTNAGDWRVVERPGGRIVLETTSLSSFKRVWSGDASRVIEGRTRVTLDAETGRVLRIEDRMRVQNQRGGRPISVAFVWTFENYGRVDVARPATLDPAEPTARLYDLLYY